MSMPDRILEPYSIFKAPQQARDLFYFFDEEPWLCDLVPGQAHAYGNTPIRGLKRVLRVRAAENLHAFIVRREQVAVGIATVIGGLNIVNHPSLGKVRGVNIDYFTGVSDKDFNIEVGEELIDAANMQDSIDQHTQVLSGLTSECGVISTDDELRNFDDRSIFALLPSEPLPGNELPTLMRTFGPPAEISVLTADPYDIGSYEGQVQLLTLPISQ